MGIQKTSTKEVSGNTYAVQIINTYQTIDNLQIEHNDMLNRLLAWFELDPENVKQVASGYIDKIAVFDSRFEQYKR